MIISYLLVFGSFFQTAQALTVNVTDEASHALSEVMVSESLADAKPNDTQDNGYPKPNAVFHADSELTLFTDARGQVSIADLKAKIKLRFRKPGYQDEVFAVALNQKNVKIALKIEKDPFKLAEAKPANVWLGALTATFASDKIHFQMQCGFCHQQGNSFTHQERSLEDWATLVKRMIRYGSRLPTRLQKELPQKIHDGYKALRENPSLLATPEPWSQNLKNVKITEWPVGDAMSQTHDTLIGLNHKAYVADNIQDRLYELDPQTHELAVYKIPHREGEKNGGLLSARLKDFPKHDSTSNAHSLALSLKDGHIFITPSAQRRLIEFNPSDKSFKIYEIGAGFYPHTIRVDQKDNVWFTLALSNQVAKFDRTQNKFTLYDLPSRNFREKMTIKFIDGIFKIMSWGIPLSNLLPIDDFSTGVPLLYGIDIAPDGKVWFARLHSKEIGFLDPASEKITMIPTPFFGPRRLRTDLEGNIWIVSFGESALAKYDPKTAQFKVYDLPVVPKGSETPYSLAINEKKNEVWVTGNQSNSIFVFNKKLETWLTIPLPKRTTFTRDFDFDDQGAAFTSNSNFPSWHIEGAQPTLIKIEKK